MKTDVRRWRCPVFFNPMRVLLVDESASIRTRFGAMLREMGPLDAIDEAEDGAAALAAVRAHSPDVVVMDLQLRTLGGLALLDLLRVQPSAPMVIVLTNQTSEAYRRQCLARGAHAFFDKSLEFDRAASALHALVSTRIGR